MPSTLTHASGLRDNRDRADLLDCFNQLWDDKTKAQDVRQQVLDYLHSCFEHQSPEFIYQKSAVSRVWCAARPASR